jgi:hypothetical protein
METNGSIPVRFTTAQAQHALVVGLVRGASLKAVDIGNEGHPASVLHEVNLPAERVEAGLGRNVEKHRHFVVAGVPRGDGPLD